MKLYFYPVVIFLLWSDTAQALPDDTAALSCKDAREQTMQIASEDIEGFVEGKIRNNPFSDSVEDATSELDDIDYFRVANELIKAVIDICRKAGHEKTEDIVTLGEALDKAIISMGLDRSEERGGMAEWPDLDPDVATCLDFVNATLALPSGPTFLYYNDFLAVTADMVREEYDLGAPGAVEKSRMAINLMGLKEGLKTEPCRALIQSSFEEQGLKLK